MRFSNFDLCELVVDGRGGISDPSDQHDPFEQVARLEEQLGWPLRIVEETTVTTVVTTRRVITLDRRRTVRNQI